MTPGDATQARVRLIVWCKECPPLVDPDVTAQAARDGAATTVIAWRKRLVCSRCGSKRIDIVATGERRDLLAPDRP